MSPVNTIDCVLARTARSYGLEWPPRRIAWKRARSLEAWIASSAPRCHETVIAERHHGATESRYGMQPGSPR